ncbi:MAG: hypothetical protein ACE5JR_11905 [Gemmatimonadota bacterium]
MHRGAGGREAAALPALTLSGLAWEGPDGGTLWGWPDDRGRVELRASQESPVLCCLLPLALSLALALRRGRIEFGARALVTGEGIVSRIAGAVAALLGCRVTYSANPLDAEPERPRPELILCVTEETRVVEWALSRCRDWGHVYSIGSGLTSGPLDYYHDIHRRALTLHRVPCRPVLRPEEIGAAQRGLPGLAGALRDVHPDQHVGRLPPEKLSDAPAWSLPPGPAGWSLLASGR